MGRHDGLQSLQNRWSRTRHLEADFPTRWHRNRATVCILIDSTIVKAHRAASGRKRGEQNQAIGISRGRSSTKIHAIVDSKGRPLILHGDGRPGPRAAKSLATCSTTLRPPLAVYRRQGLRTARKLRQQIKDEGAVAGHPEAAGKCHQESLLSQALLPTTATKSKTTSARIQRLAAHRLRVTTNSPGTSLPPRALVGALYWINVVQSRP